MPTTPYKNPNEAQAGLTAAFQPATPQQAQAISQAAAQVPVSAPSPISVAGLSQPQTPIAFTQPNNITPYPVAGLGAATPEMTLTAPEQQASDLSTRLQQLNQRLVGESAARAEAERAQGVQALQTTQKDLTSRLNTLKNEALAIPLQMQSNAVGNQSLAGLQTVTNDTLRRNAIQSLSVNSLLEATNGNLASAVAMADRAVKQRFDPVREEIDVLTKNLDLILKSPEYSLADKNRAQKQLEIQEQRKTAAARAEKANETALAMAAAATVNNPGNQLAQLAAQQVLQLDPMAPDYLQKVFELVGQFQVNPLEQQQAEAELAQTQQNTALAQKKYELDVANSKADTALAQRKFEEDKRQFGLEYALRKQKQDAELAPVSTTPSALAGQSAYNKLGAKQKSQADAANNIHSALKTYRADYDRLVNAAGSNIAGKDSALLESSYNALIFQVAQAVGTGALQQADREVIEKIIPNPTTLGGAFGRLVKGGKQGGLDKIDSQISQFTKQLTNYGLTPTDLSGASTSNRNTTKSGKSFDVAGAKAQGYSDAEIEAYLNSH